MSENGEYEREMSGRRVADRNSAEKIEFISCICKEYKDVAKK